jgi:probable HAF family extracellular repeat protein
MFKYLRATTIGASLLMPLTAPCAPGPNYEYRMNGATITELGSLGGSWSIGEDINNIGEIVGVSANAAEQGRAFYFNGNWIDVSSGVDIKSSHAFGINDAHEVVGEYFEPGEAVPVTRAFYWKPGTPFTPLSPLTGNTYPHAFARAISGAGRIAGGAFGNVTTSQGNCAGMIPVTWSSPTSLPAPIRCPNGHGYATDINAAGSVVGVLPSAYSYLFRYIGGAVAAVPVPSAVRGLVVASTGEAHGINAQNHMAGFHIYIDPDTPHVYNPIYRAFYWNGVSERSTPIGPLAGGRVSVAYDINTQRMVVGKSEANPYGIAFYEKAYIWHADFGLKELPSLPMPPHLITPGPCVALAMNDRTDTGLVQATGSCIVGGKARAVRWDINIGRVVVGPVLTP